MRWMVLLSGCAVLAYGQPRVRFADVLVLDGEGRPAIGLTAADFTVTEPGKQLNIVQFAYVDAVRHTMTGSAEALDLTPDEIHRNFAAIVDDLALPAAGIHAVQTALRRYVEEQMTDGDRMAVLRTSGGTGVAQQFTSDRRILNAAIDGIQFLGGNVPASVSAGASWIAVRDALEGLRPVRGRKFIVLFSPNLQAPGEHDVAAKYTALLAQAAMTAVYAVDPAGPTGRSGSGLPCPLEVLAGESGGAFGGTLDAALRAETGYYALGFEGPDDDNEVDPNDPDLPATRTSHRFAGREFRVRRERLTLRARSGYAALPSTAENPAPVERNAQIRRALKSPYEGAAIRTQLTAAFNTFYASGGIVDVSVVIDMRDVSFRRDLKGVHHAGFRVLVDAVSEQWGLANPSIERNFDVEVTDEAFKTAVRDGGRYTFTMRLPGNGAWRMRAAVADGMSDRLGADTRTIEIPDHGRFTMSDLDLHKKGVTAAQAAEDRARRVFNTGDTLQFLYAVFFAKTDEAKKAHIEIRTRVFSHGEAVYAGAPLRVDYAIEPGRRQSVNGSLALNAEAKPGDYILEITVKDLMAGVSATRFIDFRLQD